MSAENYQDWCRRLRDSDRDAFERVFRALHDPLFRYALSITTDEGIARDIVQETFLRLWERRESLDPERSLRALLFRMVRNTSYNQQRDYRRRKQLLREEGHLFSSNHPVSPDGMVSARHLGVRLQEWIDALPERQREALLLSRYEDLTHEEVAEVMKISPRTVNNHLVRALKTLRDRIREYEPELLRS